MMCGRFEMVACPMSNTIKQCLVKRTYGSLKQRTMFTASCLLKTQPRVRGKCSLYRYGPSPAVTS